MKKIGVLYLNAIHFQDEANQTVGSPIVGKDMEQLIQNRRMVTGKLTEAGKKKVAEVKAYFLKRYGVEVKLKWSAYAGCSICPCSPGFKIKVDEAMLDEEARRYMSFKSNKKHYEFNVWVKDNGKLDVRPPQREVNDVLYEKKLFKTADEIKKIRKEQEQVAMVQAKDEDLRLQKAIENTILSFPIGKIFTYVDVISAVKEKYPEYIGLDKKEISSRFHGVLAYRQMSDTIGTKHYFKELKKEGSYGREKLQYTRDKYQKRMYIRTELVEVK